MEIDPKSPLKALYAGRNDMPVLTYPHDLGTSRKGHFITFSVLVPQKSTYKDSSSAVSSIANASPMKSIAAAQSALNNAVSTASSTVSGVTSAISEAASVANQALSTAHQVIGSVAAVAGAVGGAKQMITSAIGTGSVGGYVSAVSGVISSVDTITSIPGVSSFLNDPEKAISDAFDGIKNFINDPAKKVSDATKAAFKKPKGPEFTPSVLKPKGYINLYMPDTVSNQLHAGYGELNMTQALGMVGGAIEGVAEKDELKNSAKSLYDSMKNAESAGDAIRTIKENDYPPIALEAAGRVGQSAGVVNNGGTVGSYLLKQQGYAVNPQFEVAFTQIDFRRFQFDFTFTPKSKEEAKTVRNIIKLFRYHASPSIHGTGGRYFDVPSTFQIEYMFLESKNKNLHSFAPCVLESIITDYAPEVGWVSFDDGMPVKTRLTLQFKETEILTREKIEEGY